MSADGRFVAFALTGGDAIPAGAIAQEPSNQLRGVFVRDRALAMTIRVSIGSEGTPGNAESETPSISADGRYVAFWSMASNLVAGDTNDAGDVFVHDLATHRTIRASVDSDGDEGDAGADPYPVIAADGRSVVFTSDSSDLAPGISRGASRLVLVRDLRAAHTTLISAHATYPSISRHGRFVAFRKELGNDREGILVRDRKNRRTIRVHVGRVGRWYIPERDRPVISANGRFVVFTARAGNLVPDDRNGGDDVFVRDIYANTTVRASIRRDGKEVRGCKFCVDSPAISATGRFVAFRTPLRRFDGSRGGGIFLRDLRVGKTTRVAAGDWWDPEISGDGRYVAYWGSGDGVFLRGPLR